MFRDGHVIPTRTKMASTIFVRFLLLAISAAFASYFIRTVEVRQKNVIILSFICKFRRIFQFVPFDNPFPLFMKGAARNSKLEEKVTQLLQWSTKAPLIKLSSEKFNYFARTKPKNYSIVAMFTALKPQRRCTICQ